MAGLFFLFFYILIGRTDKDVTEFVKYLLEGSGIEDKVDFASLKKELEASPDTSPFQLKSGLLSDKFEKSALSFGQVCVLMANKQDTEPSIHEKSFKMPVESPPLSCKPLKI